MVLSEKDLYIGGKGYLDTFFVRHVVAGVQLYTSVNIPNKTLVQTLDPLGNVKTSQEYEGFSGFWDATKEFERLIEEILDLEEIVSYEVGDVVFIDKPIGNLKKGDAIAITEISPDGLKIKKFIKLDAKSLQKIVKSPLVKKLIKNEWAQYLRNAGLAFFDDIIIDAEYEMNLPADSNYFLPPTLSYRNLIVPNNKYQVFEAYGGGIALFQNFVFQTNANQKTKLMAKVEFEDGSDGIVSLDAFSKKID